MDRLPLPLPFSPDLLWRYPNPFVPPPSPLETHVKSGLPGKNIYIFYFYTINYYLQLLTGNFNLLEFPRLIQGSLWLSKILISRKSTCSQFFVFWDKNAVFSRKLCRAVGYFT